MRQTSLASADNRSTRGWEDVITPVTLLTLFPPAPANPRWRADGPGGGTAHSSFDPVPECSSVFLRHVTQPFATWFG